MVSCQYMINCFDHISTDWLRNMHVFTRKLDLDQTSMVHKYTKSKRHKCDKTHFWLQIMDLFAWHDSVWVILITFVTQNGA